MATHPAYVSQYSVVAREVRARRLEVSQTVRWLGILVVIVLVCLLYVGLTSRLAVLAAEVQGLREREAQLISQNEALQADVAQGSDPRNVAGEAAGMGMVPVTTVEYRYISR